MTDNAVKAYDVARVRIDGQWMDYATLRSRADLDALKAQVRRRGDGDSFCVRRADRTTVDLYDAQWQEGE